MWLFISMLPMLNCDGKNNPIEFIFAHYDYKMFIHEDLFFENWDCRNIHYEFFILQITIVRILLMKIYFLKTYCDCKNLKDNLLKINYGCRNDHDIFLNFANCNYRNPLNNFFPLAYCN
jgi:hypothetical protein